MKPRSTSDPEYLPSCYLLPEADFSLILLIHLSTGKAMKCGHTNTIIFAGICSLKAFNKTTCFRAMWEKFQFGALSGEIMAVTSDVAATIHVFAFGCVSFTPCQKG